MKMKNNFQINLISIFFVYKTHFLYHFEEIYYISMKSCSSVWQQKRGPTSGKTGIKRKG